MEYNDVVKLDILAVDVETVATLSHTFPRSFAIALSPVGEKLVLRVVE